MRVGPDEHLSRGNMRFSHHLMRYALPDVVDSCAKIFGKFPDQHVIVRELQARTWRCVIKKEIYPLTVKQLFEPYGLELPCGKWACAILQQYPVNARDHRFALVGVETASHAQYLFR